MRLFDAPRFCQRVACITDDPSLAAVISSMFGDEGEYVAILPGPRMDRPDYTNEVYRRCNAVVKVGAALIVLAALDAKADRLVREALDNRAILSVRSADDAVRELCHLARAGLDGELRCRAVDIGQGLLEAKRQRRLCIVDNSAPALDASIGSRSTDHLIVLDDHDGVPQVIAANYAFSLGMRLQLIPSRDESLRDRVYADLDERGQHRHEPRGERAHQSLVDLGASLGPSLQFGSPRFITFITRGLPYGYFYQDAPSTHLFSYPHLGETIVAGIFWEHRNPFTLAAVLVDSGDFGASETPVVAACLAKGGTVVEQVVGRAATTELVRLFVQAYPYDLLFICSHCGEASGERWTIRVPDSDGRERIVVFDETVQFAAISFADDPRKDVEVTKFHRTVSIDGRPWFEALPDEGRHYGGIWDYLRREPPEKWSIISREPIAHVAHATAIKVRGGCVILSMINVLDVSVSPIIFNNACVSYYDAAQTLTFAGARAYVGTLTPVSTTAAQELAELLFRSQLTQVSLPLTLWLAQLRVFSDPNDRTYIHVGCHFVSITPPQKDVSKVVRTRVRHARDRWREPPHPGKEASAAAMDHFARFLAVLADRWDR